MHEGVEKVRLESGVKPPSSAYHRHFMPAAWFICVRQIKLSRVLHIRRRGPAFLIRVGGT